MHSEFSFPNPAFRGLNLSKAQPLAPSPRNFSCLYPAVLLS
jgi:hypothetical protein